MATGPSGENIELRPVQCVVTGPENEGDDDVYCLPSEAALQRQTSR